MELQLDTFDVILDFDAGTATVIDVLSAGNSETTDLHQFLETARSFADDLSMCARRTSC